MEPLDEQRATDLLVPLASGLHAYGMPSHRLEAALETVADALSLEAQFLVTPTSIQAAIGPARRHRTVMLRVEPGETNLEKLTRLTEVMDELVAGTVAIDDATRRIEAIAEAPLRYGSRVTVAGYALVTGTAALVFAGGWRESIGAMLIGGVLGLIAAWAVHRPRVAMVYPALAAVIATVGAELLAPLLSPFTPLVSSLAGMIVLVPGLTVTIAVNELASRHLVSGTARLTGALITFLQIGIGIAVGGALAVALTGGATPAATVPLDPRLVWLALPVIGLGFTILFRARPVDYPAVTLAAVLAYTASRFGQAAFGAEIGAAAAAWLLGAASNLLARWRKRPSAITLLPGLLMLVPGAIGFRSVSALLHEDVLAGIGAGFEMAMIAASLVTGLFLANVTVPPRRFT